ncbi:MAG TPA: aspartate ammonia-lyase [Terriglobales bacterium]|jgi:aspartate ammonia-lyase|nr:aspartate ammonia-lyase [Terriglobales bacterium]
MTMNLFLSRTLTLALALIMLLVGVSASAQQSKPRIEKDLLGEKEIPADAYYGVQTARALENFQLSGVAINHYPGFVEAWAIVKLAAARANTDVGAMKKERLDAIEKACKEVMAGKYHDQFQVDWYQGGAGTSTNMNANEVLANVALEASGHKKGEYQFIEPHDDLNMSQSTNDSYPTAIKVAILMRNDKLVAELEKLVASFRTKGDAFLEIVKMGRTEMQDAVPMTVGQEFHAFAASLESEIQLLKNAEKSLYAVNMGATAIGTGINAPEGYAEKCAAHLAKLTGKPIVPATDMLAATWDQQGFIVYSSALKSLAIKLSKISGDLILLTSGPRAGLSEIDLPALQPGSSIMPGKVNPVVPEVMNLVTFRVMGNDYVATLAAHSGQLQLNAYEPIEGLSVLESQHLLYRASILFRTKCIDGITVNEEVLAHYMETTVGIVTALNPILGYDKSTELAQEAYKSGKGILEIIREKKILTEPQIKELLDPAKLTNLNKSKYARK